MNQNILNTEVQEFITKNLNSDIAKLLFKGSPFQDISIQELVAQIEAKKKAQYKLPTWFATKNSYYPNKLNIEQTSSEITARYKADLISGNTLIDLTGGFGIDCFAFTETFKEIIHCEINQELSDIARHNFMVLEKQKIKCHVIDGIEYLQRDQQKYDWIYIDPSRRNDHKGKVFLLKDCLPNLPLHLNLIFKHTSNVLVKTSPMLDIFSASNELSFVKEVHIIAVQNEVKEVLYLLEKGFQGTIAFKTINFSKRGKEIFNFIKSQEEARIGEAQTYLYEPNAAILKAGAFAEIAIQLQLIKLHKHSHLYTSNTLIDFPGRRFKIKARLPYAIKKLAKYLAEEKANITTRNFPETVAQIRKKTKLKDGGNTYLFFTTNSAEEKMVLVCEKC